MSSPIAHEVNFDGLAGPTHSYAGLAHGNLASESHRNTVSNPRAAALQGLAKMRLLASLGVKQAVLPPHPRPDIGALRRLGFSGTNAQIVEKAWRADRAILASVYSSSFMWVANAATVSPSADTADGRLHLTPANLIGQFHRSLEAATTSRLLREIFKDSARFVVHDPLPSALQFGDEGAANHTRLCVAYGEPGIEIFTFGRRGFDTTGAQPSRYPARQTVEASCAVACLHGLEPALMMLVQQNPAAIDAGVFHNDVIAIGNQNVLLFHEEAYVDTARFVEHLRQSFEPTGHELILLAISAGELSLADAVGSYLFNSQLVTVSDGSMALIAPAECEEIPAAKAVIDRLLTKSSAIKSCHYIDVRQSMKNGGGPACLRLRVVMNEEELSAAHQGVMFSDGLAERLSAIIQNRYREELKPDDLADPKLIDESRTAAEEIWQAMGLSADLQ